MKQVLTKCVLWYSHGIQFFFCFPLQNLKKGGYSFFTTYFLILKTISGSCECRHSQLHNLTLIGLRTVVTALRSNTETHRADALHRIPLFFLRISPSPSWMLARRLHRSPADKLWTYRSCHGNILYARLDPWIYAALMETMSPQQDTMGQKRSDSLTGESKALPDNKKVTSGHVSLRNLCFWCAYWAVPTYPYYTIIKISHTVELISIHSYISLPFLDVKQILRYAYNF